MGRFWKTCVFRAVVSRLTAAVPMLLLIFWELHCPIRALTGVPCPGCGLTRAWYAALRLDFPAAFALHPLFWAVPVLVLYFLFRDLLPGRPSKRMENILCGLTGLLFLSVYIIRIWVLKTDI